MSFMGLSLGGGWPGVVSPWAAFRLRQWAQSGRHRGSAEYSERRSHGYIRGPMTGRSRRHKVPAHAI
jgi:hypothetical protein